MAAFSIESTPGGVVIAVKTVPNSKSDAVTGVLGDALKVKVSAPPEGGRANRAVCALLARTLGVDAKAVSVVTGRGSPRKRVAIMGLDAAAVQAKLDRWK